MTKVRSVLYLVVYVAALSFLRGVVTTAFPSIAPAATDLWFASGLLLVVLGVLVTEKWFTRPLDVVVNALTVVVVLQTMDTTGSDYLFSVARIYALLIGSLALLGFTLGSEDEDPKSLRQQCANALYRITSFLGSSKVLFSAMFVLSLFTYFVANIETGQAMSSQEQAVLLMIVFWVSALLVEPIDRTVVEPIWRRLWSRDGALIGRVVRRHEPYVVMVAKTKVARTPTFGDLALVHSKHRGKDSGVLAMYLDEADAEDGRFLQYYVLEGQPEPGAPGTDVSAITAEDAGTRLSSMPLAAASYARRRSVVGTIAAQSTIDVIRIRMLTGVDGRLALAEGDLVTVALYGQEVKYQVIGVTTADETVSGANKAGTKLISAQQIGGWDSKRSRFVGAAWVPDVNALVYQELPGSHTVADPGTGFFRVGYVPKSPYPVHIEFAETVSHHLAIIGKTGTGKSLMAARMVEQLVADGYKVVLLEVDNKHTQSLSKRINSDLISNTPTTWATKTEKRRHGYKIEDEQIWACTLNLSPEDGKRVIPIDLNSQAKDTEGGPHSHAESACAVITQVLAHKQKPEHANDKICIVLEEAYDFIPESTFGSQDFGQPNVSRIAQLVLKCRKHEVGFVVITQRTALVSKTILYQCNTIIALQTFDETSRNFMSAYINNKYLESMSILPRFRAIVVGKGSSCDKPIIVDFEISQAPTEPAVDGTVPLERQIAIMAESAE
jgi:hypothetical protein